jgi:peroxiredoxin Q/BCP
MMSQVRERFGFGAARVRAAVGAAVAGALALAGCGGVKRPDGGTGLLPVGSATPDLRAKDQHGAEQSLAAERGHPTVVYFYPKDATPGCTKEACAFRDAWDRYKAARVQVFGVSSDDVGSHEQFAKAQKLPFPLLADTTGAWATAFGVPSTLGMTKRVTFLLDKDGKVAKVYPDVDPGVHAGEVLGDATALP